MSFDLETVLTSKSGFGLTTASPLQRAICRIADGLPLGELAHDPDVRRALNCEPDELPGSMPKELYLLSGIRCGKSLFAAALAVRATQIVDCSQMMPGEEARVSILALSLDSAKPILSHIRGALQSSALKHLQLSEFNAEGVMLRHPSGRPIEIKVVAMARAGATIVARWSAGVILDEAPRMIGEDDGVENFDVSRKNGLGRLLPGAQLFALGSPWAPFGPVYDIVQEHWGKPTPELIVIRGTGPTMNPTKWTPAECASLEKSSPVAYQTDVLGNFADPEGGLLAPEDLEAVLVNPSGRFDHGHVRWFAAMDPSGALSKRNAWTLVLACKAPDGRIVIGHAQEWRGLDSEETLRAIGAVIARYGVDVVHSDRYAAANISASARHNHGYRVQIHNGTTAINLAKALNFASLVSAGTIGVLNHPGLLGDLRSVRRRLTQAGEGVIYPRTSDGRHCDFAPAAFLAVAEAVQHGRRLSDGPGFQAFGDTRRDADGGFDGFAGASGTHGYC